MYTDSLCRWISVGVARLDEFPTIGRLFSFGYFSENFRLLFPKVKGIINFDNKRIGLNFWGFFSLTQLVTLTSV
jgi:hypothetical protein